MKIFWKKSIKNLLISTGFTLLVSSCATYKLDKQIDFVLNRGIVQYSYMMKQLPENRYPKTFYADKQKFETSKSDWWCSGFYPGTMIYLDESAKKPVFKKEVPKGITAKTV